MRSPSIRSSGFTIVEAIVGVAILGVFVSAAVSFSNFSSSGFAQNKDRIAFAKLANSITSELSLDLIYKPTRPPIPDWDQKSDQPYFDAKIATLACYSKTGYVVSADHPSCKYQVRYFKTSVNDDKFNSSSDVGALPLSRLFVRIEFTENGKTKVVNLSRFITPVLMQ